MDRCGEGPKGVKGVTGCIAEFARSSESFETRASDQPNAYLHGERNRHVDMRLADSS
jgi:hypothetical protein